VETFGKVGLLVLTSSEKPVFILKKLFHCFTEQATLMRNAFYAVTITGNMQPVSDARWQHGSRNVLQILPSEKSQNC
jgi:hypothetical protein